MLVTLGTVRGAFPHLENTKVRSVDMAECLFILHMDCLPQVTDIYVG